MSFDDVDDLAIQKILHLRMRVLAPGPIFPSCSTRRRGKEREKKAGEFELERNKVPIADVAVPSVSILRLAQPRCTRKDWDGFESGPSRDALVTKATWCSLLVVYSTHPPLSGPAPLFIFSRSLKKKKGGWRHRGGGGDRFFFKRYKTVKYHSERKNTKKKWDQEIDIIIRYLWPGII